MNVFLQESPFVVCGDYYGTKKLSLRIASKGECIDVIIVA